MDAPCLICGGTRFEAGSPSYQRCATCGHERLAEVAQQTFIINDPLQPDAVRRDSVLDRFQGGVLDAMLAGLPVRRTLVDIGSGSGKFLLRHAAKFERAVGIEITPDAVNFSRNTLGLEIAADIATVSGEIDLATAWHSLEHFPPDALDTLLRQLAAKLAPHGRVIVSVPNAASFQARWYGGRFAFHDVPNHLHQFTPDSLRRLFDGHGFVCTRVITSWPYNFFGHVQGLLNCAGLPHNHFYYRAKRGRAGSRGADILTAALLPLAVGPGLALGLFDAAAPARQGVLTWCFARKP